MSSTDPDPAVRHSQALQRPGETGGICRIAVVGVLISLLSFLRPVQGLELCHSRRVETDTYTRILTDELRRRSRGVVLFAYIVTPSFSNEYGFALAKVDSRYSLTAVKFTESVWYGSVEEAEPGTVGYVFSESKVKARSRHVWLAPEIGNDLHALLRASMNQAAMQPPDGRFGFDGVGYTLMERTGRCAEAWSPDNGTFDANVVDALDDLYHTPKMPTQFLRRAWQHRILDKWRESARR